MLSTHPPARVVLVTGGTGGIGRSCVTLLVERGWTAAFTWRSDPGRARALLDELDAVRPGSTAVRLDLADPDAVAQAVEDVVGRYGRLDAVVHAAGPHVPMAHLSRVSVADLRAQVDLDVASFFAVVSTALPALRASHGSVVAVTTAATTRFPKRDGLSSTPKAAVEAMARAFAAEEGRYGVRVNCVGPGMLSDGMAERLISSGDLDEAALAVTRANIPLGRFGTARDVAEAVGFLISDKAGFVSGQKLDVDGGYGV